MRKRCRVRRRISPASQGSGVDAAWVVVVVVVVVVGGDVDDDDDWGEDALRREVVARRKGSSLKSGGGRATTDGYPNLAIAAPDLSVEESRKRDSSGALRSAMAVK